MSFFSAIVTADKPYDFKIPPEEELVLTNAALRATGKEPVSLYVEDEEGKTLICTLIPGTIPQYSMQVFLESNMEYKWDKLEDEEDDDEDEKKPAKDEDEEDEDDEDAFTQVNKLRLVVEGKGEIHVTGSLNQQEEATYGSPYDEDEEDEDMSDADFDEDEDDEEDDYDEDDYDDEDDRYDWDLEDDGKKMVILGVVIALVLVAVIGFAVFRIFGGGGRDNTDKTVTEQEQEDEEEGSLIIKGEEDGSSDTEEEAPAEEAPAEEEAPEEEAPAEETTLTMKVNGSSVNVRSEASTNGEILTQVNAGETVEVLGDPSQEWVQIRCIEQNNEEGYVMSQYLSEITE